jgi:DNA-binding NtrC family response regulator
VKHRTNSVLIIDDDESLCLSLKDYLSSRNLEVVVAHTGADALAILSRRKIDLVLLDQRLPDGEGSKLCPSILSGNDQAKIIFITAYPSFSNALEAIKAGAYDYLTKPFELEELSFVIDRALRTLELEKIENLQRYQDSKESEQVVLIGSSAAILEVKKMINLAATSDTPVLITGETGTGKNVVAKAIHYASGHHGRPFVSVNCAALPESLIEAELFGYEKGAYTGASTMKRGAFEMAEGGTIFLDEIGEMPLHLQSKLLGVLDDKTVKRLGGELSRTVNVRIIAATNADLKMMLEKKRFRHDLYYRIGVFRIHMPPLRERKEDIPDLCSHFIKKLGYGQNIKMPESEIQVLMEYHWPGNVRELKNIIERAIIHRKGEIIEPSRFINDPQYPGLNKPVLPSENENIFSIDNLITLEELEKRYIRYVFEKLHKNYTRTAKTLGISLSTLKRKMKSF